MEHEIVFDIEKELQEDLQDDQLRPPLEAPAGEIGQQPRNYIRNFKKTVCAFWVKGMCMKGDKCGFLHEMIPERMPECQTFLKKGVCNDPDCPFKHTRENIKECNMYALGFCIYGPECRYNHTRKPGPPPHPSTVEAAKPKIFRDINRVVNAVNQNVAGDLAKRPRLQSSAAQPSGMLPGPRPPAAPPPTATAAPASRPHPPSSLGAAPMASAQHSTPPRPHGFGGVGGGPRGAPPAGPRPGFVPLHMQRPPGAVPPPRGYGFGMGARPPPGPQNDLPNILAFEAQSQMQFRPY